MPSCDSPMTPPPHRRFIFAIGDAALLFPVSFEDGAGVKVMRRYSYPKW
jgi:hypothetical protein